MIVEMYCTTDDGQPQKVLQIENREGRNKIVFSYSKQLEQTLRNSSIIGEDKREHFFEDGLPFLKAILFHYKSVYLYAKEQED